ncbi:uncharacterized protein LOC129575855 [Sitodiplosis mosellana]|uniref:uncharacterized protein LOC129575855 n=1 Tax=Sitodiplosis mosellana TaxID=263140 RepID=UPI002444E03A|nr:uncharacterized protein LOC129575855 [Sitodiplosis mosellana]XP_055315975.1 uncharacterized protein LOC129575855 [Sitodiplosis mosellana]
MASFRNIFVIALVVLAVVTLPTDGKRNKKQQNQQKGGKGVANKDKYAAKPTAMSTGEEFAIDQSANEEISSELPLQAAPGHVEAGKKKSKKGKGKKKGKKGKQAAAEHVHSAECEHASEPMPSADSVQSIPEVASYEPIDLTSKIGQ